MLHETIRGDAVRVGDLVFNSLAFIEPFRWSAVRYVKRVDGYVVLTDANGLMHWHHPAEGVAVIRAQ